MNPRDFAETSLLGTLLHEPGRVRQLDWLDAEDFYNPGRQQVFAAVRDLVAEHDTAAGGPPAEPGSAVEGVDPVAVWQRVQRDAEFAAGQHPALTAPGLHTLMQTAPPAHSAQPAVYGQMVLESSVRRQISQDGMRVGQASTSSTQLATMLDEVGQALDHLADVEQRWHSTSPEAERGELDAAAEALRPEAPTAAQRDEAEHALVEHVLARPELLDNLPDLDQGDFADPAVAATLNAAAEVHADPSGPRVDPVTVAWHQQRRGQDGLTPQQLASATQYSPAGDPHYYADVVLRGSLASHSTAAAETVQRAAQDPTLQPEAVLDTARAAWSDVQRTAHRATAAHPAQLAAHGQASTLDAALRQPTQQHPTPHQQSGGAAARGHGTGR